MIKKGRKKGFIFTIDAIAALGVVIVLAVTWSIAVRAKTAERYFTYMEKIARDEAVVDIYANTLQSDDFNSLKMNTVCKKYFTLRPNDTTTRTDVNVSVVCIDNTLVIS
ncbi:MAG: hypothetical protein J7L44_04130 [Candidatus Diapherotrites archaeon]|nr:hypothetical protein [Candidatus Diapherotrites archaeon]